jgi:hypothetical protein
MCLSISSNNYLNCLLLFCRIKKLTKHDIASQPWLKGAPYCIDLAAADAGVLLVEASTAAAASAVSLNGALAAPFNMTSSKVQLPPWYQVNTDQQINSTAPRFHADKSALPSHDMCFKQHPQYAKRLTSATRGKVLSTVVDAT